MEAPKLSGYTRDQRWYEMNAKSAAQDVTKPDMIELSEVRAKIETADKSTIFLSATGRLVQSQDRHPQRSTATSSSGPRPASRCISKKPSSIPAAARSCPTSRSRCSRRTPRSMPTVLKLQKSGEIVRFIGGVVMNLNASTSRNRPRRRRKHEREGDQRSTAAAALLAAAIAVRDGAARAAKQRRPMRCRASSRIAVSRCRSKPPARGPRQGQGRDLQRQREGGAGRYHHALQDAGGVLRAAEQGRPAARRPRRPCRRRSPAPAARRRSAGWKPAAASPSPRRTRPPPATRALFDMKTNTVTLPGNVLVSQGPNVHARRDVWWSI